MLKLNIHKRVKELIELISDVPREDGILEDDLDFLRISIKYFMFDLEACKRELGKRNE